MAINPTQNNTNDAAQPKSPSLMRLMHNGLVKALMEKGLVTEAHLDRADTIMQADKCSLMRALITLNIAPQALFEVTQSLSNLPRFDFRAFDLRTKPPELLSTEEMEKNLVFPLRMKNGTLYVAVADPTDSRMLETLRFKSRAIIEPILVAPMQLVAHFESYGGVNREKLQSIFTQMETQKKEEATDPDASVTYNLMSDKDNSPIVRFINGVLADAITRGVSDLHFEPYEHSYRVRFRIDGVLQEVYTPPDSFRDQIAARIKVMSQLDITEKRVPQDGRIKVDLKGRIIDFRVSICPTLWGEKIVMRILDSSAANLNIEILGFSDIQKKNILEAIQKPQGMILVTGPTGSGKTVTLYTCLGILNQPTTNISTAEDPVEINLEGINQVPVNPKVGLNFAAALKSFLRQDPDIIMVGEIRDLETADIAIKAAQTGHLVLSTLHTNSAPETLTRLINMGVETFNIASTVHLIIAQRLARRLCSYCKEPVRIESKVLESLGFSAMQAAGQIYGPVGCEMCNKGYKGRVGIYEVMPISDTMERMILDKASAVDIAEQARLEGVDSIRQSAIKKVVEGVTSIDELLRVTTD
nr:type IV-A pilus assembly ATPase PilB [Wohlfahrtiimonas chitiniclastica]